MCTQLPLINHLNQSPGPPHCCSIRQPASPLGPEKEELWSVPYLCSQGPETISRIGKTTQYVASRSLAHLPYQNTLAALLPSQRKSFLSLLYEVPALAFQLRTKGSIRQAKAKCVLLCFVGWLPSCETTCVCGAWCGCRGNAGRE